MVGRETSLKQEAASPKCIACHLHGGYLCLIFADLTNSARSKCINGERSVTGSTERTSVMAFDVITPSTGAVHKHDRASCNFQG